MEHINNFIFKKGEIEMNIEHLLDDVIEKGLTNLKEKEVGTEEYKSGVDSVTKLLDRSIEINKNYSDADLKFDNQNFDNKLKEKQFEDEKRDRIVRNGIAIAGIIVPTVVTIWGTLKSFKFEEEGTVTTIMGRGFINKLLPRK